MGVTWAPDGEPCASSYGNLIKKPWVFFRAPNINPKFLGVVGPGFLNLNDVPTLPEITRNDDGRPRKNLKQDHSGFFIFCLQLPGFSQLPPLPRDSTTPLNLRNYALNYIREP